MDPILSSDNCSSSCYSSSREDEYSDQSSSNRRWKEVVQKPVFSSLEKLGYFISEKGLLGKGSFGRCYEATCKQKIKGTSLEENDQVVIKVPYFPKESRLRESMESSVKESEFLELLNKNKDLEDRIVKVYAVLQHSFEDRYGDPVEGSVLVMEKLFCNLKDFVDGLPGQLRTVRSIRDVARTIFSTLEILQESPSSIVHRDLSFCNMMIEKNNGKYGGIKLIDFGSSSLSGDRLSHPTTTSYYRSPEDQWGCPFTSKGDMFSAAAIVYEYACGHVLFQSCQEAHHHRVLIKYLGSPPPISMFEESCLPLHLIEQELYPNGQEHKFSSGSGSSSSSSTEEKNGSPKKKYRKTPKVTKDMKREECECSIGSLKDLKICLIEAKKNKGKEEEVDKLCDLLNKIFLWDPKLRLGPREALNHPFFREEEEKDS